MYTPKLLLLSAPVLAFAATTTPVPTASWSLTYANPAQESALSSYRSSISANTKLQASLSSMLAVATVTDTDFAIDNTQAQSILNVAATATSSVDIPDIPKDLPGDVKSLYSSVYKHEISILTKQATNTQTGTNAAPQATGGVKVVGAAAAGVLGVAALL